jgi:uncharacterized protein (DUF885 family)
VAIEKRGPRRALDRRAGGRLPFSVIRFSLLLGFTCALGLSAAEPTSLAEVATAFQSLAASKGRTHDSVRLRQLFDLEWRHHLIESPESATYSGFAGQNHRWSDLSKPVLDRQRAELARPLQVLATIDRAQLGADDQLYFDLFKRQFDEALEGTRFPDELLPMNQMGGVQQGIAQILSLMPVSRAADFADVIARLEASGQLVEQTLELLRAGLAKGLTPPRITLRDVPQQLLNNLPADPRASAVFRPFRELPATLPEGEKEALRARALAAITNVFYPKFRELHRFLVEEYVPGARASTATAALPDGEAWYAFRARRYTTTTLTPRQIHAIGLAEVKRIRADMDQVIAQTGFKGTFAEFLQFLRTDRQFYFDRGAELLAGYRDVSKRVDLQLPKLFGRLPRLPYGVLPIPSHAEKSQTTAYYQPGAASFGRPGVFYANTYALETRPKYEMEALTLHEAVPGHHLQIAIAQELEGVPDFQKHSETTAFVEGWGLYAEKLGEEMGFYTDPYSKFGQLTYEMWRAIRLVVDTGMHSLGWTREQAIEFFKANAGKTEHDIIVEVDRYLVWPGQALAYKIGELKLRELRTLAQQELGARFDVRHFHDELLSKGALPLDVLEPRMKAWINRQKLNPAP